MTLFSDQPEHRVISPGAVHLAGWLSLDQQRALVRAFNEWSLGPVPMRSATVRSGYQMSVKTVCLGWHWQPYTYTRTADDVNGLCVAPFPEWLGDLARSVVAEATGRDAARYQPDAAMINYYDDHAKMGMHQDRDETVDEPVVSLSVGNTCRFRFGNIHTRNRPYTDIDLQSGDAFVFGGESRFAYHGVTKIFPHTSNPACGLEEGRINITMRVTGKT